MAETEHYNPKAANNIIGGLSSSVVVNNHANANSVSNELPSYNIRKELKQLEGEGEKLTIRTTGFQDFLVCKELLRSIEENGFELPSEVQHACIPQALLGTDIICQAKSGMGKTAVFTIAVLNQIFVNKEKGTAALVLCHTRELAVQIKQEFQRLVKYFPDIKISAIFGGVPFKVHREDFQKQEPNIVVGCPGRVKNLANDGILDLSLIKHFVIDECDKVLSKLDMRIDVQKIFKETPKEKQTMMFSATLPMEARRICAKFLNDPIEVYINDEAKLTLHGLVQHYVMLTEEEKNRQLTNILDNFDFNQAVIFVKSVVRARELNKLLNSYNFPSMCLHGDMEQEKRLKIFKEVKKGDRRILVATDLFGRGIDIERINIVINYDMPETNESQQGADTYLHRVGRAGRFGTKGMAITFVASEADSIVLNSVQERFDVSITSLPSFVPPEKYMNSEGQKKAPAASFDDDFQF